MSRKLTHMPDESDFDTALFFSKTIKRRTAQWFTLLISHFISGAFTTISSALGVGGAHAIGLDVQPMTFKQLGAVFVFSGIAGAAHYAKDNPLFKATKDDAKPE